MGETKPLVSLRPYQLGPFWRDDIRLMFLLWRRQSGKSHMLSSKALRRMMQIRGLLVTYVSASLNLGREFIVKEASVFHGALAAFRKASEGKFLVETNADAGSWDDFCELFESQKLETKIWHDRSTFSRSIVIAPNVATARGWTGDVFIDEVGFIRDFKDLFEALEPILISNPAFRCLLATTPPNDDAHFSYELAVPPPGLEFEPRAEGNWYESESGITVHRTDALDCDLAGQKLYDLKTGRELTPAEHRAQSLDREAWDRNYGLIWKTGGTSAVSLQSLNHAQTAGVGKCVAAEEEYPEKWRELLGDGPFAAGYDIATTERETSNPSSLTIAEKVGGQYAARLVIRWKTADPERAFAMLDEGLLNLGPGKRLRRLKVDASNEKYFATLVKQRYAGKILVDLVAGNDTVRHGSEELTAKEYLGNQLVNLLDDGQALLPPDRWIREDFRLVKRDRGTFATESASDGSHGDSFDSTKLAFDGLSGRGGPAEAEAAGTTNFGTTKSGDAGWLRRSPEDFRVSLHT